MKKWIYLLIGLMLASPLFATLIVEEHFIDMTGTGSTGLTKFWGRGSITTGLNYSGLFSSGGALTGTTTSGGTAQFDGTPYANSTVWFSVLVSGTVGTQDRLMFFSTSGGSSNTGLGIEISGGALVPRATRSNGAGIQIDGTATNLVVGKMTLSTSGSSSITIWLNPTDLTSEATMQQTASGTSTISDSTSPYAAIDSGIYPRQNSSSAVYDEIRMATKLAEVIPEPPPAFARFVIIPSTNSIIPGIDSPFSISVKNTGGNATGVVTTLISSNPNFSVISTNVTPSEIPYQGTAVNTFTVRANNAATAQLYTNAFQITTAGRGQDGILRTTTASVGAAVQSTVFSSMIRSSVASATNSTATFYLSVTNTATFDLNFALSASESWLTPPAGTLTLAAGTSTNIAVIANSSLTPGEGQYQGSIAINYLNNGSVPNPNTFPVTLNVGAQVKPLTADVIISEDGGVNQMSGIYEPGEILEISITSTNSGFSVVTNILNTLRAPAGFTIVPSSTIYPILNLDEAVTTTYQVTIGSDTPHGNYTFTAANTAGGITWDGSFTLPVFNQATPSVSPLALTLNVPYGGTAEGFLTLTNSGNASTTYALTDNGVWDYEYSFAPEISTLYPFGPIYDVNSTTFTNWFNGKSEEKAIGFEFPFFGNNYTSFIVNDTGFISLVGDADNTDINVYLQQEPFSTNSIRVAHLTDKLVVAWNWSTGNGTGCQAWLYPDGSIRYVYGTGVWSEGTIGVKNGEKSQEYQNTPNPVSGILVTPAIMPWVASTPQSGLLNGFSSQTIRFAADAGDQSEEKTTVYTNFIFWGNSTTSEVVVTVNTTTPSPELLASDVTLIGPAGWITHTNMTLSNIGDIPLHYSIIDSTAQSLGYGWEQRPFENEFINWDSYSKVYIPSNSTVSVLTPIGFEFPFYGGVYTNLSIGINGGISLGVATLMPTNSLSAAADVPSHFIAPYWRNLTYGSDSTIHVSSDGKKMVATWVNMLQSGHKQTFQALLYKNGEIRFQYYSISGATLWPGAEIGLRDSSNRTTKATLAYAGSPEASINTMNLTTNYLVTTNGYIYDTPILTTNIVVVTNYSETVMNRAIVLYPKQRNIISVRPTSGTLPVGASTIVKVSGNATGLTGGGSVLAFTNTTFQIISEAPAKSVAVGFEVTNSVGSFSDADGDGMSDLMEDLAGTDSSSAQSIFGVAVKQNPDGSRIISWPASTDGIPRTYKVYWTSDLTTGWIKLFSGEDLTSYKDTDPAHAALPVIYYKVTVEVTMP